MAHSLLLRAIGNAEVRVTVVLTPEQRRTLEAELREASGGAPTPGGAPSEKPPGTSIVAGAVGVELGPQVRLHGVILCDSAAACSELAGSLKVARDARAADPATRLVGFGAVLEDMQIEARGDQIHARVEVPEADAKKLLERLLVLRGIRHPVQSSTPERPRGEAPAPSPDEVIPAEPHSSAAPRAPSAVPSAVPSAAPSAVPSAAPPKKPASLDKPAAPEKKEKSGP
jgi:hypothetical protein